MGSDTILLSRILSAVWLSCVTDLCGMTKQRWINGKEQRQLHEYVLIISVIICVIFFLFVEWSLVTSMGGKVYLISDWNAIYYSALIITTLMIFELASSQSKNSAVVTHFSAFSLLLIGLAFCIISVYLKILPRLFTL